MVDGIAVGVVLGFLLATAYGALFHLLVGGGINQILLYIVLAWLGFVVGHLVGGWLGVNWLQVGSIQLFSATVGTWLLLFATRWLISSE